MSVSRTLNTTLPLVSAMAQGSCVLNYGRTSTHAPQSSVPAIRPASLLSLPLKGTGIGPVTCVKSMKGSEEAGKPFCERIKLPLDLGRQAS